MKKIFFLAFWLMGLAAHAQLPLNFGFEAVNADGSPRNWGNVYIYTWGDSIVFDQHLIQISSQAYRGQRAVELRNAYNYSQQRGIAGSISLDTDSVYTAWGSLEFVPVPTAPTMLGFWYQFNPVNGDTAQASLTVSDSMGNEIGRAHLLLTQATTGYTYAQIPVTYTMAGNAAFVSLNFSTFYTADVTTTRWPSLGTRLLLDEVELQMPLGIATDHRAEPMLLTPNPVANLLRISPDAEVAQLDILDPAGRLVRQMAAPQVVDLHDLAPGLYVARLHTRSGTTLTQRLVKE